MAFWPAPPIVLTTVGPLWATNINSILNLLPSHNHTQTGEAPIPAAALNINANVPFTSGGSYYNASSLNAVGFFPQTGTAAKNVNTPNTGLFVDAANNLFYVGGTGNLVPLTTGGGTTISPSGTGANNGFYGGYATGAPNSATAYYSTGLTRYEFHTPVTANTPSSFSTLAQINGAYFVSANPAGSLGYAALIASNNAATYNSAPTGGWALVSPNNTGSTYQVAFDSRDTGSTSPGTYLNGVMTLFNLPNSVGSSSVANWGLGINVVSAGGFTDAARARPAMALDVWYYGGSGSSPTLMGANRLLTANSVSAGWGPRQVWQANLKPWAGYGNAIGTIAQGAPVNQGALESTWFSVGAGTGADSQGQMHLHGAYAGTVSTSGLIVAALDNTGFDYFGLGVNPSSAWRLDVGPTGATGGLRVAGNTLLNGTLSTTGASTLNSLIVTNTTSLLGAATTAALTAASLNVTGNTILGTNGANTVTTTGPLAVGTSAQFGGSITVSGGPSLLQAVTTGNITTIGNITVSGTLGVSGATTLSSTLNVTGATVVSSTIQGTNLFPSSAASNMVTTQGGIFKNNQVLAWGVVSSGGVSTQGFNASASRTGAGAYTITFTVPPALATYAVSLAVVGSGSAPFSIILGAVTAGSFNVLTYNSAGANDEAFHFTVIGAP
jgi:hypothetical protein